MVGGLTADSGSIDYVWDKDPMTWNDKDMDQMISHYRKERVKLDALPIKDRKTAAAKTPKQDLSDVVKGDDLLTRLGIPL